MAAPRVRVRRWPVAFGLGVVLAFVCCIHFPVPIRTRVTFRGDGAVVSRDGTLVQYLDAGRCIPFWSCTWNLFTGFETKGLAERRPIHLGGDGGVIDTLSRRRFSLGAYAVSTNRLVLGGASERDTVRRTHPSRGVWHFHILDLMSSPTGAVIPLFDEAPGGEVLIDLSPAPATRLVGLEATPAATLGIAHCLRSHGPVLLAPGASRSIRYEFGLVPRGTTSTANLTGEAEAFLVDMNGSFTSDTEISDRDFYLLPDLQDWIRLRAHAVHPHAVRLQHDAVGQSVSVEWDGTPLPPSRPGDVENSSSHAALALVVGRPAPDGGFFGIDCVELKIAPPLASPLKP